MSDNPAIQQYRQSDDRSSWRGCTSLSTCQNATPVHEVRAGTPSGVSSSQTSSPHLQPIYVGVTSRGSVQDANKTASCSPPRCIYIKSLLTSQTWLQTMTRSSSGKTRLQQCSAKDIFPFSSSCHLKSAVTFGKRRSVNGRSGIHRTPTSISKQVAYSYV